MRIEELLVLINFTMKREYVMFTFDNIELYIQTLIEEKREIQLQHLIEDHLHQLQQETVKGKIKFLIEVASQESSGSLGIRTNPWDANQLNRNLTREIDFLIDSR